MRGLVQRVIPSALVLATLSIATSAQAAVSFLQDSFSYTGVLAGQQPDVVNDTGRTYNTWTSHAWGDPSADGSKASVNVDNAQTITISDNGTYVKPDSFYISAQLSPQGISDELPVRGISLGFFSTQPVNHGPDNFYGLVLTKSGRLTLILNGSDSGQSATLAGPFDPNAFHQLSYYVDTVAGSISQVKLDGQSFSFTTTAFTDSVTNLAGFYASDDNGAQGIGFVDNFTLSVPEPTSVGLVGLVGLLAARRQRA